MNVTLKKAYENIFQKMPAFLDDWQIVEKVLENFDFNKLGEKLAKEFICGVVLDVHYPNHEITKRIVGRAEGLAGEIWDDLPDEVHMADLERKRYLSESRL
ncbi:MAG: hypothetical protein AAB784_01060 [Patescibacteria group bacterium]